MGGAGEGDAKLPPTHSKRRRAINAHPAPFRTVLQNFSILWIVRTHRLNSVWLSVGCQLSLLVVDYPKLLSAAAWTAALSERTFRDERHTQSMRVVLSRAHLAREIPPRFMLILYETTLSLDASMGHCINSHCKIHPDNARMPIPRWSASVRNGGRSRLPPASVSGVSQGRAPFRSTSSRRRRTA